MWVAAFSCDLITHLIGYCTIKMSKSNQGGPVFRFAQLSSFNILYNIIFNFVFSGTELKFNFICFVNLHVQSLIGSSCWVFLPFVIFECVLTVLCYVSLCLSTSALYLATLWDTHKVLCKLFI